MERSEQNTTGGKPLQHARLLKEENEEIWISSEDLRTEGSSSEEGTRENQLTLPKSRKRRNKKMRSKMEKKPVDSSSKACCSKSEECTLLDRDTMDLESHWRPKRGSLKLPHLITDGQTVENFNNEIDRFYNEMLNKVSLLRENPLTENNYKETENYDDGKENEIIKIESSPQFAHSNNEPEVHNKLKFIRKLDDDITGIVAEYQYERVERLKVHKEFCENIHDDQEETYAQLCNIYKENRKVSLGYDLEGEERKFLKRNIELVKSGKMACCCLMTDEDKQNLCDLLETIDECAEEEKSDRNLDGISEKNAFALNAEDQKRIEEINLQLAEMKRERNEQIELSVKFDFKMERESFWKDFLAQQALKEIDQKLSTLIDQ